MVRRLTPFEQAQLRARALRENGEHAAARLVEDEWRENPEYEEQAWLTDKLPAWSL